MSWHDNRTPGVEPWKSSLVETHTISTPGPGNSLLNQGQQAHGNRHGWPTSPKPVRRPLAAHFFRIIVDVVLIILSIGFLAFALTVRHFDQSPTAEHPETMRILDSLSKIGPSVFPILFAAVMSRTMHAILLWRLEKGERVGMLDLLAGSTSLTGTFNSQLHLRMTSIVGLLLISIWILSPIGGQASIRQLSFSNGTHSEAATLSYMLPSSSGETYKGDQKSVPFAIANSIFLAALYSPITSKNATLDLWGNVKVPVLEWYEKKSVPTSDGWFDTDDGHPTMYASLIGTPIADYEQAINTTYTFDIDTSYLHLDCPIVNSSSLLPHGIFAGNGSMHKLGSWFYGNGATIWLGYNASCGSKSIYDFSGNVHTDCTCPPDLCTTHRNLTNPMPRNFTYVASGMRLQETFCTITTTYIQAEIICPSTLPCRATKIRRSRLHHPPAAYTVLDDVGGMGFPYRGGDWGVLLHGLTNLFPEPPSSQSTILQQYLTNPDATNPASNSSSTSSNLLWAIRQGQLMNSFLTSVSGTSTITAGRANAAFPTTTTATKTTSFEILLCHHSWTVALALASSLLILACILHPILLLRNKTPDLLMNISSLATRDNVYVEVPEGGTGLDAARRARLLKHLKVRFGDVEGEGEVGRLAVGGIGEGHEERVGLLRKGRLYR